MEKLRNTLNKVLNLLAGLSMTVMVVLTTYQVIVRYIFNSPSTWSEELVGYLFGWSTMLGATIVSGERGHMNIPVLVDRFNPSCARRSTSLPRSSPSSSLRLFWCSAVFRCPGWLWDSRPPRWA